MKRSMNMETKAKEKIANIIGGLAKDVANTSSDKCFFLGMYEPKMPKALYKRS
mgnify:CR=1 FL=1